MIAGHRSLCLRVPGKPCWRSQRSQTFNPLAVGKRFVVQAALTRRQWLLRQEAHVGDPSVRGWMSSRRVSPYSSSKQAKDDIVGHASPVDRLGLSGPNGVCKHASMQHQTSCRKLGSSSGYRQQCQQFVFDAKQMWTPSG